MFVKIVKIVFITLWICLLGYSIYIMFCITLFSLLSCTPDTNMEILIQEHIIPNTTALIAMCMSFYASFRGLKRFFNKTISND